MAESKTVVVDGQQYEIHMLPAEKALDVLERLWRLLGPALKNLVVSDSHDDMGPLAGAAMALATSAPPGTLTPLVKDLLSSTLLQGSDCSGRVGEVFSVHFQGRTLSALKLAVESAKVNFGDFFAAAGALQSKAAGGSKASST